MRKNCWVLLLVVSCGCTAWAGSYYRARPADAAAVYLTPEGFGVKGDGLSDDTAGIQQAINKVQETTRQGIVFVPAGRYRISNTIHVWPGIRLIGYGAIRPALVLGANTAGFTDKNAERYMVLFAGGRPTSGQVQDANPGTFYSAISNIDVEIGPGNEGASAVRSRYAQHCFLAHMEMRLGPGIAGIHEGGNVVEDVRFIGGQHGVWTGRPSPGWQFTLIDVSFEGQRGAAIREREAGLTLIRPIFRNVPAAIEIEEGRPDELWVKDGRMENITGPAVVISAEKSVRTEVNMENVVCRGVAVFAMLRESGKKFAGPGAMYAVKTFSHGLHYADIGAAPEMKSAFEPVTLSAMPAPVKSDLPELPEGETWVNARTLGAKGDGKTDDTAVLKKAIAEHRAIYLPMGIYVISDTLVLRPDTVLIGMHPNATQIDLLDSTPGFQGVGGPKALVEAPKGGNNILIGIGVYPNGINPRALAVKWMAGADSLMNDVRLLGGHGTAKLDGSRENPYNNNRTADPDVRRRWDSQYPSLWVTGGGGTFLGLWTANMFAQAGLLVTDTTTEGRVYGMSSEHHVRHEVQLRNVSNWHLYALQTEAERGESGFALPLEIDNSSNITVANFLSYRVISSGQPFPWMTKVSNSRNIRFRNLHCYSNSKVGYDAMIFDQTHKVELRQREFAWLTISGDAPKARVKTPSPVLAAGAKVEKLAGGFYNISGGAASPAGDFFFVDAKWQRIYLWRAERREISTVHDFPLDPVNLFFDKAGNLMVLSYAGNGTVYAFRPDSPAGEMQMIQAQTAAPRPGMTPMLPVGDFSLTVPARPRPSHYVSPDGTTFISADPEFVNGTMFWGTKGSALLRTFGLAAASPGKPFYLSDEYDVRTYQATVGEDGQITGMKIFAEQGGEGVAVDSEGNVYLAAGQIYVYNPAGKLIDTIDVPERPLQLVFGGKDGRTLFIPSRTSLYSVATKFRGR